MRFIQFLAIAYKSALSSKTSVVENTELNDARMVVTTIANIATATRTSINVKPAAAGRLLVSGCWFLTTGFWLLVAGSWILDTRFCLVISDI
jgi:hypothetical protein